MEIYKRFLANMESVVKVRRRRSRNLYALPVIFYSDNPSSNSRIRPRSLIFTTLDIVLLLILYSGKSIKEGLDQKQIWANFDSLKNNSVSELHCEMLSRSLCISLLSSIVEIALMHLVSSA